MHYNGGSELSVMEYSTCRDHLEEETKGCCGAEILTLDWRKLPSKREAVSSASTQGYQRWFIPPEQKCRKYLCTNLEKSIQLEVRCFLTPAGEAAPLTFPQTEARPARCTTSVWAGKGRSIRACFTHTLWRCFGLRMSWNANVSAHWMCKRERISHIKIYMHIKNAVHMLEVRLCSVCAAADG